MDRTACIDVPAFPLQLLLRRHADWREHPAAVVESDRPQGTILWTNEKARASGVLRGMRYAAGLSLAPGLRAGVVSAEEIDEEVKALAERLRQFTPRVEPAEDEPGVFWLDARGLERLFGSLTEWAATVQADVVRAGFRVAMAVGFTRFGVYSLARSRRGVQVWKSAQEESQAARAVPLDRLLLPPAARDALAKLGVTTVGQFLDLPVSGIGTRFGLEVRRLHRLASGDLAVPLQADHPEVPALKRLALDYAERDAERIVAVIESLLGPFLDEIASKGRTLAELQVGFRFERLGDHLESIRPATPTLSEKILLELVRLRLEAVRKLPDGVVEIVLVARETQAAPRQKNLFVERGRRDAASAERALARVRAQLGDASVVRACLRDGHLPEAHFTWEPLREPLPESRPALAGEHRLVRRIHTQPVVLPPRERHEPDGWMLRGLQEGPVLRVLGPYVVSGGWWNRPIYRDYHFAETRQGDLLWIFYDRMSRRWFLHGRVE